MAVAWTLALLMTPLPLLGQPAAPPIAADRRIEGLISRMTLDEKLGQLVQMPGGRQRTPNSRINDEERARVRSGRVGSYINVAGAKESRALQRIAVEESRLGIPLIFAMD